MKVVVGDFVRFGLEAGFGSDLAAGVQAALVHYARRLRSDRSPIAPPCFARDDPAAGGAATVELAIEQDILATLQEEARRRHVSLNRVMNHAVFVYLADLDAAGWPGPGGGWWPTSTPTYH